MIKLKKKTSIYLSILLVSFNCAPVENNAQKDTMSKETLHLTNTSNDACFEASMETWFLSFNLNQQQGLNMYEADVKSLQDADQEFNSCQQQLTMTTANHEASFANVLGI